MCRFRLLSSIILGLASATPALANGTVVLPEPSSLALLAIGATGLLIGRKLATKRSSDED